MNKKPLISVIIPIYNVEKYIHRCVESVICQTYMNLEIVLVDDGSPDGCGKICDEYKKLDSRIKVIHKSNGGLSDARNCGVREANGEYIAFIDSDDYVASDYVEYLYWLLEKYNADISVCCMVETAGDYEDFGINKKIPSERLLTGKEASMALMNRLYMVLVTVWGKLYRSEIVKKNPFPIGKTHEDEAVTCRYYYEAKRVVVGNRCLYAYYQNPDSITHAETKQLNRNLIWALEQRARFYEERNEKILAAYAWSILFGFYARDSRHHLGRCDRYIRDFENGKNLLKKTKVELKLYNTSHLLYWGYYYLWKVGRGVISLCIKKH